MVCGNFPQDGGEARFDAAEGGREVVGGGAGGRGCSGQLRSDSMLDTVKLKINFVKA